MRNITKYAIIFIAIYATSTGASAHIGNELHNHSSFVSGLLHPLGGVDHLLAMLAVGIWSAVSCKGWALGWSNP
jgi:urease accessory protein